jgi:hypothetical protein
MILSADAVDAAIFQLMAEGVNELNMRVNLSILPLQVHRGCSRRGGRQYDANAQYAAYRSGQSRE